MIAAALSASTPAVAQQAAAKKDAAPAGPVEAGKPWPPADEAAEAAAKAEAEARAEREAAAERERAQTRAELSALRSSLDAERAARINAEQALSSRVEAVTTKAAEAPPTVFSARIGLGLTGFVQSDFTLRQSSTDQLNPSGAPLNTTAFAIRRARLRAYVERWWVAGGIEFDGNTLNGPMARLLAAEASLKYPGERGAIPLIMGTIGVFKIPFGFEVIQSDRDRLFMERANVMRALFPGEYDAGARLMGAWRVFRYVVAVQNGNPVGDRSFPFRDPNAAKDVTGRFGVDVPIAPGFFLAGGASGLTGTGFHAGTAATKPTVQWNDVNGDGVATPNEIMVIPGAGAQASQNFPRFAVGGDLRLGFTIPNLGATLLYGEIVWAKNLDRGLLPADPITFARDYREFGAYGALTQEIGPHWMVGARYDFYNPDADSANQVMGAQVPTALSYQTLSVTAALRGPSGRLIAEFDLNRNHNGRDVQGNPTNLADNAFIVRGEVTF